MIFSNQTAFDDPASRLMASGTDLRVRSAITDTHGRVLAYAQTGGILNPTRFELAQGATMFRFGSAARSVQDVARGGWWLEQHEFDKVVNFANVWSLSVGAAMRMLCLVPPEWSDATLLVRADAGRPLLAWRGLANSVVTPATGGGRPVRMPHQNDIAARRLNQLFVPGLAGLPPDTVRIERTFPLDARESVKGFLYL